jgi:transcriptional regulator with XRE-family HTH domain
MKLGALLRRGREKAGMTLESAATMIGMTNISYLSRCELGSSNFPGTKLKRAIKVYGLDPKAVVDTAVEDYEIGMDDWLLDNKKKGQK